MQPVTPTDSSKLFDPKYSEEDTSVNLTGSWRIDLKPGLVEPLRVENRYEPITLSYTFYYPNRLS